MKNNKVLLSLLLLVILGMGWLDYATGPRLSFALFYLIPISIGSWVLGSRAGWLLTISVCLAQFLADIGWGGRETNATTLWNLFTRVSLLGALGQALAWIRRDRDALDQRLTERTSAHVATVEQLRHRDRLALVGQIASGLAHEMGTPLNIISGRSKLLAELGRAQPGIVDHARSILEQTERMTAIIRQLLDFARRRGPEPGTSDVYELSRRVLDLLRPFADRKRVALKIEPSQGACVAGVDYNQIQQALSNLVVNAIQAMPDGGEVRVQVRPQPDGGVSLSVRDTGKGIPPELLGRIFEPFFTTQGAGEGTGLGLSITEGIVRDHRGTIDVTSEVGRGSCFTIQLPAPSSPKHEEVRP
jgi:two-component system NtrC family sensor kinase